MTLLVAASCSKPAPPPPALPVLDCAKGFDALAGEIAASPALHLAAEEPGEPYRFYAANAGGAAYVVTKPGAPGHPAILMQRSVAGQMQDTGCPFGDRAGYDQVAAYLKSLRRR